MQVEDLKTWFRKMGYPDYLIKEQVEKALRLIKVITIIARK